MEFVSAAQGKNSAEMRSNIYKRAEEAQVQASAQLLGNLRQMVNELAVSDVVFICNDGEPVQASRTLLAGRSDVLKSMVTNNMAESSLFEIVLPDISSPVLLSIFEFLYTGTLLDYQPQSWRMAFEVMNASRFFQLPNLEMITRKLLLTDPSIFADDLTKAASLVTEVVGFDAPCDERDVLLQELVTVLSSNWSNPVYVLSLSEDAFQYLLTNSKCSFEDDDELSVKEYLRFRQVIRWWVYHSDVGTHTKEELVNLIAPAVERAVSLCRDPDRVKSVEGPPEDAARLSDAWSFLLLDEASKNSAIRLLSNIDCRGIHPVLLTKVVEPLKMISPVEILNSFRFHALRRAVIFKKLGSGWEHGESYRTLEQGYVIYKLPGKKLGLAVMKAAMSRSDGVYQWRFILEEVCDNFVELGFFYYVMTGTQKPNFDCQRLSAYNSARVLKFQGSVASVNWEGAGKRVDWKVLGFFTNITAFFNYNASEHVCSLSINDQDFGIVWKNLQSPPYYPAVSIGNSSKGRVRIELVSGFDIL